MQGRYRTVTTARESFAAFIPAPLPPAPALEWTPELRSRFDTALVALGRLDALTDLLPNASLLLYSFVRKEAVLSSMIEGTQSSLDDLLLYELAEQPGVPLEDARQVSHCVAAIDHGVRRLEEGIPLSLRLIREMHGVLLADPEGAGTRLTPGEFRQSQVWVGGTRPGNAVFVPPPADEVTACLRALERFLHDDATAPLVRAALAHVQFETIHPFLDGNGRIGRLLVTLQLCSAGLLRGPMLYLSHHFKQHRSVYYELLGRVRTEGDWEAWLLFFADAIIASAADAESAARRLLALATEDARRIEGLGRAGASAFAVHRALQRQPIATAATLGTATGLTPATVNKTIEHLRQLGLLTELTGRRRGRVFSYARYAAILGEGLEPPG